MSVRYQLILAFLLLAVLPLAGIVFYSFLMSQRAFREAVAQEAQDLSGEMKDRLDDVRGDLNLRVREVAQLSGRSVASEGFDSEATDILVDLVSGMGQIAGLVDYFEFTPAPSEDSDESFDAEPLLIYPSKALAQALERLTDKRFGLEASGLGREYLEATIAETIQQRGELREGEEQALVARGDEMRRLLGSEMTQLVRRDGKVVGNLKAMVPATQILNGVLERTPRDEGEVPFALDAERNLYVEDPDDRELLGRLGIPGDEEAQVSEEAEDWIVVETLDPKSGLTFGVARPVRATLREIRSTAARNFAYGLALVALALVGVLWLSTRMTRSLTLLTRKAELLAAGDLDVRVPITSRDEFGQLASTFNRMARELSENQERLLREERLRKDEEIQRRLLEAENERKSRELEEAREFQLSLLPRSLPKRSDLELAVSMRTATEVGGDYYDFFQSGDGSLTTAVGDAAGHGVSAGTMVTVVKGLLTASATRSDLAGILGDSTEAIRQMNLGRMNMALSLARLDRDRRLSVSMAGMPPLLLYRERQDRVEEVSLEGTPLGSMANASYGLWESQLHPGDTLLFMTDGFPELLSEEGEPFGYARALSAFEESARQSPEQIVNHLSETVRSFNGDRPPADDVTFVVMKLRA